MEKCEKLASFACCDRKINGVRDKRFCFLPFCTDLSELIHMRIIDKKFEDVTKPKV